MQAISMLQKQELHNHERPLAQLAALTYNINRGKKAKPLNLRDFCIYRSATDGSLPDWRYGASLLKAVEEKLFPSWAFFVYKDLRESAGSSDGAPEVFIASCSDVVVLGPEEFNDGQMLSGFFIVNESCSEKIRQIQTNNGVVYTIQLPKVEIKYMADEDMVVPILAQRLL